MSYKFLLAALPVFVSGLLAQSASPSRKLTIVKPVLHQYDGGPPAAPGYEFTTGDSLSMSFQINGYKVSPESKIELAYQIDALDPDGIHLVKTTEGKIQTQVSGEDKDWMPVVRDTMLIPPLAFSGTYRIEIRVDDKLAGQTAKSEVTFPVRGRQVEPSKTLVARNFRFFKSEEDRDPLVDAVYHPGEELWARFEMTGFQYGENNRVHVVYGIAILGPSGNQMFSQPQAAVEQDESFYPKRYLPGVFSVNLDKKVRPGEYTLVLTLRDETGNQTVESRHVFHVE